MRFRLPITALLWLVSQPVFAAPVVFMNNSLKVNTTGSSYQFWSIIGRIVAYLSGAIAAVAVTMFVVGAMFVTLSGIKEDWRQKGKDLMIGSIFSLAVVMGAYSILRMVEYFLTT